MKETLTKFLLRIGVFQCYAGYPYFVSAVEMAIEEIPGACPTSVRKSTGHWLPGMVSACRASKRIFGQSGMSSSAITDSPFLKK